MIPFSLLNRKYPFLGKAGPKNLKFYVEDETLDLE